MSDFTSTFWDYYVGVIAALSILGCAVFLKLQSKRRVKTSAGDNPDTTGHAWDGIQEFHNPMPRWWIGLFYLSIVFAVVYLALYPGLGSQYKGALNWSSVGQFKAEMAAADAQYQPLFDSFLKRDLAQVAADPKGRLIGERIFLNNCAQCHGSDAHGSRGFPNLTDEEWMWGGTPEAIETTITDGREGVMPPLADALGGAETVIDVAHYVLSLSGSAHDSVRAVRGQPKFALCAACHGPEGKGGTTVGAPDLTNKIWLYGGSVATIVETITHGRHGVMPTHKGVLTPAEIHLVAAYVYSLSHGSGAAPVASATQP